MVRDALAGTGRIGMIQPHAADGRSAPPLFQAGCVGEIVGVEELDDGRFNIVLHGSNRFRLIARGRRRHALSPGRRRPGGVRR